MKEFPADLEARLNRHLAGLEAPQPPSDTASRIRRRRALRLVGFSFMSVSLLFGSILVVDAVTTRHEGPERPADLPVTSPTPGFVAAGPDEASYAIEIVDVEAADVPTPVAATVTYQIAWTHDSYPGAARCRFIVTDGAGGEHDAFEPSLSSTRPGPHPAGSVRVPLSDDARPPFSARGECSAGVYNVDASYVIEGPTRIERNEYAADRTNLFFRGRWESPDVDPGPRVCRTYVHTTDGQVRVGRRTTFSIGVPRPVEVGFVVEGISPEEIADASVDCEPLGAVGEQTESTGGVTRAAPGTPTYILEDLTVEYPYEDMSRDAEPDYERVGVAFSYSWATDRYPGAVDCALTVRGVNGRVLAEGSMEGLTSGEVSSGTRHVFPLRIADGATGFGSATADGFCEASDNSQDSGYALTGPTEKIALLDGTRLIFDVEWSGDGFPGFRLCAPTVVTTDGRSHELDPIGLAQGERTGIARVFFPGPPDSIESASVECGPVPSGS